MVPSHAYIISLQRQCQAKPDFFFLVVKLGFLPVLLNYAVAVRVGIKANTAKGPFRLSKSF